MKKFIKIYDNGVLHINPERISHIDSDGNYVRIFLLGEKKRG